MPEPETPAQTHVDSGTLCVGCAYDLGGLPIEQDAVCPECGLRLEVSLKKLTLREESPEWLRRIARGLLVLRISSFGLTAFMIGVVVFIVWLLVTMVTSPTTPLAGGSVANLVFAILYSVIWLWFAVSLLGVCVGMFMLAKPPSTLEWTMPEWWSWVRAGAVALPFAAGAWVLLLGIGSPLGFIPTAIGAGTGKYALVGLAFIFLLLCLAGGKHAMREFIMDLDDRATGENLFNKPAKRRRHSMARRLVPAGILVVLVVLLGMSIVLVFYFASLLSGFASKLPRLRERVLTDLHAMEQAEQTR